MAGTLTLGGVVDEQAVRLRLLEAAAQTAAVRSLTDPTRAAEAAVAIATLWYNDFVGEQSPGKRKTERPASRRN